MADNVYLSLGSNLGDRGNNLDMAIGIINEIAENCVLKVSDIYETEPVGYTNQGRFLNMAVNIETGLPPLELLNELQGIESLLKRKREIHWGPRTIDIDILLYDQLKVELQNLTIPHPRMLERAFVLVPLKDVYPGVNLLGHDINVLIGQCSDKDGVRLWRSINKITI